MFSAPPTLCFHKSPTRQSSVESGQVLPHPLSRSMHPCPQLCLSSSSFRVLPPPVSSSSRRPACARSLLSAFLCGFAVFFRLVFFFPSRFAQRRLPIPSPNPARAFTFRLPGRNYRVLRFASGLSVGPTGGPLVETALGNIRGTRDSTTLSSLPVAANVSEPLRENLR